MSADVPKMNVYEKIQALIEENTADMAMIKEKYDSMKTRQKSLIKLFSKLQSKSAKPQKNKANRKPCGFARPTPVSDEMCDFLKIEKGSDVSRTTVTRALIQYIKENNLQNPENKKQILPDSTLSILFGENAKDQTLTYFTMQKFVNHHFKKVK
jgi:chromatin remodeling complex protein RSC6